MPTAFKNPKGKPGTIGDLLDYELPPAAWSRDREITCKLIASVLSNDQFYGIADALYDIANEAQDTDAAIMQTFLLTVQLAKLGVFN